MTLRSSCNAGQWEESWARGGCGAGVPPPRPPLSQASLASAEVSQLWSPEVVLIIGSK